MKLKLIALSIMISGAAPLMANVILETEHPSQLLRLPDVDEGTLNTFSEGLMGDSILECPEGFAIPFKLDVRGEFFILEPMPLAQSALKLLKTCYVRCVEKENFLFSTDLKTWKEMGEFFTGTVTISLTAEKDETFAGLQIEINQKSDETGVRI
jgi:hypothetical protein